MMFGNENLASRLLKVSAAFLVVITLRLLITGLYNLFFHPLRNVPGPLLARVSRLWARAGNFHGCKSQRIHAAHQKYGPVVRVGPNELSFADPSAVRDIYTNDKFVKEETFYRAKRIFHENHMMSFRDPEAHKQRRKLLSRGFSQAAMLDFEESMSTKIDDMLKQWAVRSKDGPIDVFPWSHWLGFDIVYNLMFDEDPGSVKAGKPHEVMVYMRAWRPTFIYVSTDTSYMVCRPIDQNPERIHAFARTMGTICTRLRRRILSQCANLEAARRSDCSTLPRSRSQNTLSAKRPQ